MIDPIDAAFDRQEERDRRDRLLLDGFEEEASNILAPAFKALNKLRARYEADLSFEALNDVEQMLFELRRDY